jgi:hypothetical protein
MAVSPEGTTLRGGGLKQREEHPADGQKDIAKELVRFRRVHEEVAAHLVPAGERYMGRGREGEKHGPHLECVEGGLHEAQDDLAQIGPSPAHLPHTAHTAQTHTRARARAQ